MDTASQLWLFFILVLGVVLLPGLDMTFVLASTLSGGRRSGFAGVAGIVAAGFVHVAVGAAGIAAVVALVPGLYNAMLIAGALYLAWIGVSLLKSGVAFANGEGGGNGADGGGARSLGLAFRRGMITNLLNPKAYAFMLAVFPQFVSAERGPIALQAIPLSAIIASTQVAVYGIVVLLAAGARGWLLGHPRALHLVGQAVGVILVAAAVAAAWQGWRS
jgi:threonine/homoserine/homoserine lactone efflux protein